MTLKVVGEMGGVHSLSVAIKIFFDRERESERKRERDGAREKDRDREKDRESQRES